MNDTTHRAIVVGDHGLSAALGTALAAWGWATCTVAPPRPGGTADVTCDLTDGPAARAGIADAVGRLGGVDLLVHGWVPPALLVESDLAGLDEDDWAAGCEAAIQAAWRVAQAAAAPLRASGNATAVFLIPVIALSGGPGFTMLATATEAIRVLAKSCGLQWGRAGVRVHTLATASSHWVGDIAVTPLSRVGAIAPALGSTGAVDTDLAALVDLLTSPDAHFLTSTTLVADGGAWMGA
jgi:2-keto-3-deoxy-L-fuconate dehydrogenase